MAINNMFEFQTIEVESEVTELIDSELEQINGAGLLLPNPDELGVCIFVPENISRWAEKNLTRQLLVKQAGCVAKTGDGKVGEPRPWQLSSPCLAGVCLNGGTFCRRSSCAIVRWYCGYCLRYPDVSDLMAERGEDGGGLDN